MHGESRHTRAPKSQRLLEKCSVVRHRLSGNAARVDDQVDVRKRAACCGQRLAYSPCAVLYLPLAVCKVAFMARVNTTARLLYRSCRKAPASLDVSDTSILSFGIRSLVD